MNKFALRRKTVLPTSAAALMALLGGCATPVIESTHINTFVASTPGLAYALPKAQIELTAERKEVKDEDVSKANAAAQAAGSALKAATTRSAKADARVKSLGEIFDKAEEPGRTELLKQLTVAKAVAAVASAAKKSAEEDFEAKSHDVQRVNANQGKWLEKASVKFLTSVPDSTARFVVNRTPGLTRDDELKLTVTNGLLNSSDATTTDQTAAVLISLAQIGPVRGAVSPGADIALLRTRSKAIKDEPQIACKEYQLVLRFDPTNSDETTTAKTALEEQSGGTLVLKVNPFDATKGCREVNNCLPSSEGKAPGLLYRGLSNVTVKVYPPVSLPEQSCWKGEALPFVEAITSALVPDSNSLYVLPHEAGAFVKTTQKYTFKDGIPVEFGFTGQSQLAAIARIPVDIAKAIVEIPAQLIKLRVDYESSANNLLLQKINALENQVNLLDAQQKLEERVVE